MIQLTRMPMGMQATFPSKCYVFNSYIPIINKGLRSIFYKYLNAPL